MTVKDQGRKYIVKKQKNVEGGTASLIVSMIVAIILAFVIATEIDLPASVEFQRNHEWSSELNTIVMQRDEQLFGINRRHYGDIRILLNNNAEVSESDLL